MSSTYSPIHGVALPLPDPAYWVNKKSNGLRFDGCYCNLKHLVLVKCTYVKILCLVGSDCGSWASNLLKSPNYPNDYHDNTDCVYRVPIPHRMALTISFNNFSLKRDYGYHCE